MKANRAFKNPVVRWVDQRLPIFTMLSKEYGEFPMPRNINYWWSFGAIASVLLLVMIFSGIVLAMNYVANSQHAFESVQRIMRDVNWGWLVRYIHSNGASLFFLAVYLHMVRGLYYGSYKEPREMLWILGVAIYLIMILTAFLGYVLPWGQMSFWAATVITSLFSAIPGVGESISQWLWGGFSVGNPTLGRFYALHYLMPFVLLGLVVLHVWALHVSRSNNPTGIEPANSKDTVPFFPLVLVKDSVAMVVFAIVFTIFVFYAPEFMGHPDNNIAADPLKTPAHIVPEWYFLPFYTILRAVPDILFIPAKLAGVIALFGAIAMLFVLPWLDTSKIRSCRYRPLYRVFVLLFMANFVLLGWLGAQLPEGIFLILGRIATAWYFIHFLVITPLVGKFERPVAMPTSLSAALRGLVILVTVGGISGMGALATAPKAAAEEALEVPKLVWSFDGPFGTYDRDQLQRGFQVFRNVCQSCHGIDLIYFRDLKGIGYNADQIKAIAAEYSVQDGPDELGEMYDRPAIANDKFANPFPNDELAKAANSGALPPDLSLMALARFGGADYIYAFLNGFRPAPHGFEIDENTQYYNLYIPGNIVAMSPQLENVIIEYDDGTPGTPDNYGRDVSAFLQWVADPYLEERHRMGMGVLIFLGVLLLLLIALQRKLSKKAL